MRERSALSKGNRDLQENRKEEKTTSSTDSSRYIYAVPCSLAFGEQTKDAFDIM